MWDMRVFIFTDLKKTFAKKMEGRLMTVTMFLNLNELERRP
jgi:hypothetical protein